MVEIKLNQLVIEKVENGYIFSCQVKKAGGLFGIAEVEDKLHYVAKTEKDLIKVLEKVMGDMVKGSELIKKPKEDYDMLSELDGGIDYDSNRS